MFDFSQFLPFATILLAKIGLWNCYLVSPGRMSSDSRCENKLLGRVMTSGTAEGFSSAILLFIYNSDEFLSLRTFLSSGGQSPVSHLVYPGSIPFQSVLRFVVEKEALGQTRLSSITSVFPCQYHSTIAPYSFIHLPPTLYNVFLPVLQFSAVSIIPPLLHTHSFIYHQYCVISPIYSIIK